jgi:hypothetical protein
MINIDAYDFNGAGLAAMALVAAMIERLDPAQRAGLIAAAGARIMPADPHRPDHVQVRARTIDLIRATR